MKPYQFFAFCLQSTFEGAKSWVKELRNERPSIVIALAGNKADLESERKVTFEVSSSYSFFTLSFCLPNLVEMSLQYEGSTRTAFLIGASLSEPHTSGTALRRCVYTNDSACLRPYTVNLNARLNNAEVERWQL